MHSSRLKSLGQNFWLTLLVFAGLCLPSQVGARSEPDIRINILKGAGAFKVEAKNLTIYDISGTRKKKILKRRGKSIFWIRYQNGLIQIGPETVATRKLLLKAKPDRFKIQTAEYSPNRYLRGELEVVPKKGGNLSLVNRLRLEWYLVGLINHEVSSSWPIESLKSQAVVARTYALHSKKRAKYVDYDLESSTIDQVYGGMDREDQKSLEAVRATSRQVLTVDGKIIAAFYHSCCGGKTEYAQHVWGGNYDGIDSVACGFCDDSPSYYWRYEVNARDFNQRLTQAGYPLAALNRVQVLRSSPSGRALEIGVYGQDNIGGSVSFKFSGNQFRSILGYRHLKSTLFQVKPSNFSAQLGAPVFNAPTSQSLQSLHFSGGGNGHGVGMCQWGARGMAEKGFPYKSILKRYYPHAKLKRYR